MPGTGDALVAECYDTFFIIEDKRQRIMVNGVGGNSILHQLRHAGFDWMDVDDGECMSIIGHDVTSFDIRSTKARQYGYRMDPGKRQAPHLLR